MWCHVVFCVVALMIQSTCSEKELAKFTATSVSGQGFRVLVSRVQGSGCRVEDNGVGCRVSGVGLD